MRDDKVVEEFGSQLFLNEVGHIVQVEVVIAHFGSSTDLDGRLVPKAVPQTIGRRFGNIDCYRR